MLSIVPLMAGGGLFETGAGGSAPARPAVQRGRLPALGFTGEFLALGVSLEHLAQTTGNKKAQILAETLTRRMARFLRTTARPPARSGRSTIAAAISISRSTGRRRSPTRPDKGTGGEIQAAGRRADGERSQDQCRTDRRPGQTCRYRRLLRAGLREDIGRHAPERDAERGAESALRL